MRFRTTLLSLLVLVGLFSGCSGTAPTTTTTPTTTHVSNPLGKINHFIIIYQENWSFDSLYGYFPGADGFSNASSAAVQQVDKNGQPYTTLPQPLLNFHHQPFAYFANYADGKQAKSDHLKDEQDFLNALKNNSLPAVSFVKPLGIDNEHPGYANETDGQQHVADLVKAVEDSPYAKDTAIIITYDENGGRWDHVSPPAGDRWGPGTRVPAIFISPFTKKGTVDHTVYDTTSILRTIEVRWNLLPLGTRDAKVNDLRNAFPDAAA